jgi:hypothetical protein
VAVAQAAPTPSISAQELQAALAESKRRLEQQSQTMSGPTLERFAR